MDNYLEKVIELASEIFGVDKDSLDGSSTWEEGLHFDVLRSLQERDFVTFKEALEDEFNIEVGNMKLGKKKNMQEIADYVQDLCEE